MMYPLVRELAAQDAPIRVPVTVTCRVLKIARQPYYRWLEAPVTRADLVAAYRANALFDATGARLVRLPLTPERVKAAIR